MKESWKDVVGAEDTYQVSSFGRVRNKKRDKIKAMGKVHNGYLTTSIFGKRVKVHRLVAKAFIPNPENKPQVNHLDFNKENNNAANLEWCTLSENLRHDLDNGNRIPRTGYKSPGRKAIIMSTVNGHQIKIFDCIKDASLELEIPRSSISNCLAGRVKTSHGFKWSYV